MTRGRRIMAARLLRTLGTIEHLSAIGNESEVRRLLAGIDPLDCQELADELDQENADVPARVRVAEAYVDARRQDRAAVVVGFFPESLRA